MVLWRRCLGLPAASQEQTSFTDVPTGSWYAPVVQTAHQAGLVQGTGDGRFHPEQTITRQEIAVIIMKACSRASKPNYPGNSLAYSDANDISPWAKEGIAQASHAGIMSGYPDGSFHPHNQASRAEAAIVAGQLLANE